MHAAIATDEVAEVGRQVAREGKLAELAEDVHHLVRGHPRGGGVPQRQRRKPIGMNVFRTFLKLGKRRQRITGGTVLGIIDLNENGAVALDDEWIAGVVIHSMTNL